jgi:hypothetical protein
VNKWKPIDLSDLERLVDKELSSCNPDQRLFFRRHRVAFYHVPINRMGKIESVYVVAHFGNDVLYYEDIEEGFELGRLDAEGRILSQGCNQYELRQVLQRIQSEHGDLK